MKKMCLVIPYRDREEHLEKFLPSIESKLSEEGIDYHILIVEQSEEKLFNRGKLLNVGYSFTNDEYDYYCFHDVDMLPLETDYSYCEFPTHLAARASQFGGKLPYEGYFGGVTMFNKESFKKVNGYSNDYWGWGAEDDDMLKRCFTAGVTIQRKSCSYQSIDHDRPVNPEYGNNLIKYNNFNNRIYNKLSLEGLNTLRYELLEKNTEGSVTRIKVKL
jgi:hypothetical protein